MIARRCPTSRRRGAVAVLVAICLLPLVGVLAFAIDGGLLLAARRRAQTVADASAHAAACQLYTNSASDATGLDVSGKARAAALALATTNGTRNDGSTVKVTVNIPPQSDPFKKPNHAEVIVTLQQPRMFSKVFGSGTIPITARAIARGTIMQVSTNSIVALDPDSSGALSISGGGVIFNSGGIQVNSRNSSAATSSGGSIIKAASIDITGNYTTSNNSSFQATNGQVMTAAPPLPDPLGSISPPDPSTMPSRSVSGPILSPGVYDSGISLSGTTAVTLLPGIYYVRRGFSLGGQSSIIGPPAPNGVMIYMESGTFGFSGNATFRVSPMTTGPYAGIMLYQSPNNSNKVSLSGGSNIAITGTIYAPNANISLTAGPTMNQVGSQFISKTMSISGQGNINILTSSTNSARMKSLTLVQ